MGVKYQWIANGSTAFICSYVTIFFLNELLPEDAMKVSGRLIKPVNELIPAKSVTFLLFYTFCIFVRSVSCSYKP